MLAISMHVKYDSDQRVADARRSASQTTRQTRIVDTPERHPVIRHIVLLRIAPTTPDSEMEGIFAELTKLTTTVPGMIDFHVGTNVNTIPGLDQGFTYTFTIDFTDAAARDAYFESAGHIAVAERLQPMFANGLDDLIMFQIEL